MNKNRNSDKNIINIETVSDLHKIPFSIIKSKKLYEFKGKYFDKIYQEALELEKKESEKETPIKFVYCQMPKENKNEKNKKCENKVKIKNKTSKDIVNNLKNDNPNKIKNSKDNIDFNFKNKKNSFEIDILNENIDLVGRLRINSCHIPRKKIEIKIKKIDFKINYDTKMGEEIGLIGSIKELGCWNKDKLLRMHWTDGNIWETTIDFSFVEIDSFEYKFVLIENGEIKEWENGNNRIFNHNEFKQIISKYKNKNIYENDYDYIIKDNKIVLKCIWNKK